MQIITDHELLQHVERFLVKSGMAPTRFGRDTMGEASLVDRMRAGRSLSLKNANKLLAFIQSYDFECSDTFAVRSASAGKSQDRTATATGVAA